MLGSAAGGSPSVDRVELVRGRVPRAVYLAPYEIAGIAFEDLTASPAVRGWKATCRGWS